MSDAVGGLLIGLGVAAICLLIRFGWWILRLAFGALVKCALPLESKALQWLQDRATARTLGADIEVIRARRKIDFPT